MLVLLAFGAMIMMLNLDRPIPDFEASHAPMWVELHGEREGLYKLTDPGQVSMIRQDRQFLANLRKAWTQGDSATAWEYATAGALHPAMISPRLSYLMEHRVPVNRADKSTLELIPGIGPYLAENIVEYRQLHGRIDNIRELRAVRGIGKTRSAKLARFFSFQ